MWWRRPLFLFMTDWPAIHRRVWAAIQASDQGLDGLTLDFARQLTKQLRADGYALGTDAQVAIAAYIEEVRAAISAALAQALEPMATAAVGGALASEFIREQTATAFAERWPDGLTLSDRVWRWDQATRNGITDTLRDGVARGASMGRMVMDLQRKIESGTGERFTISGPEAEDWMSDLHEQARGLIHGKVPLESWLIHMEGVREHLSKLKTTGTQHAARQAVDRIRQGVKEGSDELLDDALKWWVYDRQLYRLQRIARTEMATAAHRGVIAATKDDDDIIGYHWRLSRSHPEPDICDYYAGIELGLGRGVWPVDQVPEHKAHPHCMCTIVPRVRPIPQTGEVDYESWVSGLSPETRRQVLPRWAARMQSLGMPLKQLLRDDGLGLIPRKQLDQQFGSERAMLLDTLSKALVSRRWTGTQRLRPHNKLTNELVASLTEDWETSQHPDVKPVVQSIREGQRRNRRIEIDARELHYIKRRYGDGQALRGRVDLDLVIEAGIRDPDTRIYGPIGEGRRIKMYSPAYDQIIIIGPDGSRITVYPTELTEQGHDPDYLGELAWTMSDLVN